MKPKNHVLRLTCFCLLAWLIGLTAGAQTYQPGALYQIVPQARQTSAIDHQAEAGKAMLAKVNADRPEQHWTISALAGSWRLMNPFTNQSLRTAGNHYFCLSILNRTECFTNIMISCGTSCYHINIFSF